MTTFSIVPRGPFSLAAAATFWGGFAPAHHHGATSAGHLHMAFPIEGSWATAGVCVREVDGSIEGEVFGTGAIDRVRDQVARILSLDVDGSCFADVGRRDPVVGRLQARFPGLRPVCFYSTYEAAAWGIISSRVGMEQGSKVKASMAAELGTCVDVHGDSQTTFPGPQALLELDGFPGLFGRKIDSLHGVAQAALDGRLNAARLRSLPDDVALAELRQIPGIGPFNSELILLRGAGHPDFLTFAEPRFRRALGHAYGLDHDPSDAEMTAIAEAWRPYRMWVTLLLRYDAGPHV